MYFIAVCDDEAYWAREISVLVSDILGELHIEDGKVDVFLTAKELKECLRQDPGRYALLILDILLAEKTEDPRADGEETGIELARELRAEGVNSEIIFLTSCGDYALDGYEVRALRYVMKPPSKEKMVEAIRLHYEQSVQNQWIELRMNSETRPVRWMDILFLEVMHNRVTVNMVGGECFPVPGGLTEWCGRLPGRHFLRCHKSFCVNAEHIVKIKRYEIRLSDGRTIPIGKTTYNQFKEAYLWRRL